MINEIHNQLFDHFTFFASGLHDLVRRYRRALESIPERQNELVMLQEKRKNILEKENSGVFIFPKEWRNLAKSEKNNRDWIKYLEFLIPDLKEQIATVVPLVFDMHDEIYIQVKRK